MLIGNGLGFWNTMPMRLRSSITSTPRRVDRVAVELHVALDAHAVDQVVQAVDAAQQRRLAAARGPDQRRHLAARDAHRDVVERLLRAVPEAEVARSRGRRPRRTRGVDRRSRPARRARSPRGSRSRVGSAPAASRASTSACGGPGDRSRQRSRAVAWMLPGARPHGCIRTGPPANLRRSRRAHARPRRGSGRR